MSGIPGTGDIPEPDRPEPRRPRKPRPRISYADRCQEYERERAANQATLNTLGTVIDQMEPAPGSEKLKTLALELVKVLIQ